jgi:hypothetical protein
LAVEGSFRRESNGSSKLEQLRIWDFGLRIGKQDSANPQSEIRN